MLDLSSVFLYYACFILFVTQLSIFHVYTFSIPPPRFLPFSVVTLSLCRVRIICSSQSRLHTPPPNTLCLIVIMISIQIPFHKWFRPHPPSALGGGRQKLVNVSSQDTRLDKDRIICGIEHLERLSFVDRTSGTWLYLLDVHVQNLFLCSLSEPGISS